MTDELMTQGDSPTDFDGEPRTDSTPTPFELTDGASATIAEAPDTVAEFSPGEVIADQFDVKRVIGRGGMGLVYEVGDRITQQRLALKTILPSVLANEKAVKRFVQEVNTARRLRHPNIVAVYDVGQAGPLLYYTMEYLEGQSLRDILNQRGKLAFRDAVALMHPLCLALEHAHQFTVHRDISPENVMVLRSGKVRLLDFGIAKALDPGTLTATETSMGKAYYMAPEQRKDAAHVDARADIYSLGVMLFEMLTGEMPMGINRVTALCPDLPTECDELIAKALAPLDQRYKTTGEFRKALEQCYKAHDRAKHAGAEKETEQPIPVAKTKRGPSVQTPPPGEAAPQAAPGESLLWRCRSSVFSYIPGLLWATGWFLLWKYCYGHVEELMVKLNELSPGTYSAIAETPVKNIHLQYAAGILALLALFGIARRVLAFIATYYECTDRVIKMRTGVFSVGMQLHNVTDLKSFHVRQSPWGRVFNYGEIQLSFSKAGFHVMKGVPAPYDKAEKMQALTRSSRR